MKKENKKILKYWLIFFIIILILTTIFVSVMDLNIDLNGFILWFDIIAIGVLIIFGVGS